MELNTQEAKLKDGKRCNFAKTDDRAIFINNKIATWQILLLIFIIITSILFSFVTVSFIGEGFDKILTDLHLLKVDAGLAEDPSILFTKDGEV